MIRIFVGCAPNGHDAESCAVLEYSIRRHASEPVEINWMSLNRDPTSPWYSEQSRGWQTAQWATPFTGLRWAVPWVCGYEGRAIYTDSDVIFQGDVAELWHQEFKSGRVVKRSAHDTWRFCVSLWNCSEARIYLPPIDAIRADHRCAFKKLNGLSATQAFDGEWNCLDGDGFADLNDPALKAIHYTDMSTQPHLQYAIPRLKAAGRRHWFDGQVKPHPRDDLQGLFDRLLIEAEDAGYGVDRYIPAVNWGDFAKRSMAGYRHAV